jgi:hypothetical protein
VEQVVDRHRRSGEGGCLALEDGEDPVAVEAVEVEQEVVGV